MKVAPKVDRRDVIFQIAEIERNRHRKASTPETDAAGTAPTTADVSTVSASNLSLHDLFAQQARHYLERADLDEEQKQTILVCAVMPVLRRHVVQHEAEGLTVRATSALPR